MKSSWLLLKTLSDSLNFSAYYLAHVHKIGSCFGYGDDIKYEHMIALYIFILLIILVILFYF